MKKILFSSAAAILSIVGFSAFKTAKQSFDNFNFKVTSPVPVQSGTTFTDGQVTPTNGVSPSCGGSGYYCVVSFTTGQLTSGHQHLNGSQIGITVRTKS